MTDDGMVRSRVPISEIYVKEPTNDIPFNYKQLWDCFSENATIIEYDFLAYHRAEIVLRDGTKVWATYMFTIDWFNNPYSDMQKKAFKNQAERIRIDIDRDVVEINEEVNKKRTFSLNEYLVKAGITDYNFFNSSKKFS
jgi:hypothetical protein